MTTLSHDEQTAYFETACAAAREAGDIIRSGFGKRKTISFKGRIDIVTDIDLKSEEAVIRTIRERHPGSDIITEESETEIFGSDCRWIIDPLDGTVNYAHDYPFAGVSIALEVAGTLEVSVVYNPLMEEFFHAVRGRGAFCNDSPISVSGITKLEQSLLATGFPYDVRENPRNNLYYWNHMINYAQGLRRDGSAALNLAYVAMGRFDGYWEERIKPWDIAAGMLILAEAGGTATDLEGGPLSPFDRQIVATNGLIHDELIGHMKQVRESLQYT